MLFKKETEAEKIARLIKKVEGFDFSKMVCVDSDTAEIDLKKQITNAELKREMRSKIQKVNKIINEMSSFRDCEKPIWNVLKIVTKNGMFRMDFSKAADFEVMCFVCFQLLTNNVRLQFKNKTKEDIGLYRNDIFWKDDCALFKNIIRHVIENVTIAKGDVKLLTSLVCANNYLDCSREMYLKGGVLFGGDLSFIGIINAKEVASKLGAEIVKALLKTNKFSDFIKDPEDFRMFSKNIEPIISKHLSETELAEIKEIKAQLENDCQEQCGMKNDM